MAPRVTADAAHRARLTQLLVRHRGGGERLCVLGAGPCNDIELRTLAEAYSEVHLVDLDTEAMQASLTRHEAPRERIRLHGGVDVSGNLVAAWREGSAWGDPVRELSALNDPLDRGGFDVVASTCLLSQLVKSALLELGRGHPRVDELALALRDRHLEVLVGLTRPGGRAILVTDIVSDETCPDLANTPTDALEELERELVVTGNFFTGVNPFALRHAFTQHPRLAPAVAAVHVDGRWIWRPEDRAFLVVAIVVDRRAEILY